MHYRFLCFFDSWGTNTLVCLRSFDILETNKFVFLCSFDSWGMTIFVFLRFDPKKLSSYFSSSFFMEVPGPQRDLSCTCMCLHTGAWVATVLVYTTEAIVTPGQWHIYAIGAWATPGIDWKLTPVLILDLSALQVQRPVLHFDMSTL